MPYMKYHIRVEKGSVNKGNDFYTHQEQSEAILPINMDRQKCFSALLPVESIID